MTTQQFRPSNYPAAFFTSKDRAVSGLRLFGKGERIFSPGDTADFVYFIADGKVKICATDTEGREISKNIFSGGMLFGEQALAGEAKRRDSAIALEDTVIRALSIRDMLLLLNGRNELAAQLLQVSGV